MEGISAEILITYTWTNSQKESINSIVKNYLMQCRYIRRVFATGIGYIVVMYR